MTRRVIRTADQIPSALQWAGEAARRGLEGGKAVVLAVTRQTRSDDQNRRMWALLGEIAEQVDWHGQKYDAETWKILLMRGWGREARLIPAVGGGVTMIDDRSSRLTVGEMAEFQEYVEAFGVDHGVRFRAPERYET